MTTPPGPAGMHIAVVDDQILWGEQLANALAGTPHRVTTVQYPAFLAALLADDPVDLALVDMDFLRGPGQPQSTGLFALRVLAEQRVPSALFATQGEENRALFLLACFHFFDPLTVVDKNATARELALFVSGFDQERGGDDAAGAPYRHAALDLHLLQRLLRGEDDLRMWIALTRLAKRPEVARAAFVSVKKLDKFLNHQAETIQETYRALPGLRQSTDGPRRPDETRGTPLTDAHEFARIHQKFFCDPTLRELITSRPR